MFTRTILLLFIDSVEGVDDFSVRLHDRSVVVDLHDPKGGAMKLVVDRQIIRDAAVSAAGVFFVLIMLALMAVTISAQPWIRDVEQLSEGREEAREVARVFDEIMSKPDKAIPRELLERAEAIAIFPDVVKAAFIFGGRGGDGIVARRTSSDEWSVPVFYKITGASFGAQIGAKKTDYVMLFMNDGTLRDLLDDKLDLEEYSDQS